MSQKKGEKGKVIEFKPRKKRKLKTVKYVDPAQKELKEKRERQRRNAKNRDKAVRNIGYFLLICIVYYLLKVTMCAGG
ncbi:hypothetical protein [Desulfofalx alkaliphila]|uniref:hypothetical protein n=1 Tax=Desulfofalx alkaliphila TaxID=105483 RepID=UPI0004E0E467|nr:hypothetical protein [Desulfofalx alkaliphila]